MGNEVNCNQNGGTVFFIFLQHMTKMSQWFGPFKFLKLVWQCRHISQNSIGKRWDDDLNIKILKILTVETLESIIDALLCRTATVLFSLVL